MTPRFVAFSLLTMLAVTAGHADGQDGKKFAVPDGTWTITKMEIQGKSLLGKDEKWKLIIKDGKVKSDAKGAPEDAVDLSKFLRLDPIRSPTNLPEKCVHACHLTNGLTLAVVDKLVPQLREMLRGWYVNHMRPALDFIASINSFRSN